ncbi:MAG: PEP-CTERM sorting domain-containing protein [Betaproteobacteria bacterium]|nr:PEP-CTERM sorting domain-containing protein [Betaproteobacteria bacterium]
MSPIPEPASAWMFLAGLSILAAPQAARCKWPQSRRKLS